MIPDDDKANFVCCSGGFHLAAVAGIRATLGRVASACRKLSEEKQRDQKGEVRNENLFPNSANHSKSCSGFMYVFLLFEDTSILNNGSTDRRSLVFSGFMYMGSSL